MEEEKNGGVYDNNPDIVKTYFKYYSTLANQQNMLSDSVRTNLYHEAITKNW